jgi:hypothetical protein
VFPGLQTSCPPRAGFFSFLAGEGGLGSCRAALRFAQSETEAAVAALRERRAIDA